LKFVSNRVIECGDMLK